MAELISSWVAHLSELGPALVDGLLQALEPAGNYVDAGATAKRIVALGRLTEEQFERLDRAWWGNDQLHGGLLPSRALRPFYLANGRTWPPPKEAETIGRLVEVDDEPF